MSHMAREAAEAPEAVARFLDRNGSALAEIGARLRLRPPPVIITSARGSSDHAAGYFKYLAEILLGIPCCSMGASVVSVYGAKLKAKDALCLTVSQSGKSPDIVALQEGARKAGAFTVAVVNVEDSPAARAADICLPLHAGPELSVAATKSFIVSLAAGAAIVAHWLERKDLLAGLGALPEVLRQAARIDWPAAVALAKGAESLYVVGRGPSLPIASETALKLKETCAIHAEAYSIAEVMHGPLELLGAGFPLLAYSPEDPSRASSREAMAKIRATGASVLVVEEGGLPYARSTNPLLDPIAMVQTAYRFVEATAQALGRDPDRPRLLKKVTETL
ncbi:MAG: SIS domain-containing protein [Rhizobiales bacterium]|nr:SIS domain-containing protein [Hyphomicrobiales bacterium]MBI3673041.1 SIS domain-containing protein [Hyphomicrobiales bacterium]